MKQTDKCECGHSKEKHKGIEELKCFHRNKNNRYCLCNNFKSHSQKIPSQTETSVGIVRASERRVDNQCKVRKHDNFGNSGASSVPYIFRNENVSDKSETNVHK